MANPGVRLMRIISYNIYGMQGYPAESAQSDLGPHGSPAHVEHFAQVLQSFGADVIALQEGVTQSLARDLARQLSMHLATFPSPTAFPGHVLSRWPVVESRTFSHVSADEDVPPFSRTAGAALLEGPDLRLWIVNIHLHPGDLDLRAREGDLLHDRLSALVAETKHAIVLGDFNSAVDEPGIHVHLRDMGFLNTMENADGGLQLTMDTAGIREWIIDHIYLSPSLSPGLTHARIIRDEGFRTDSPRPNGQWDHSDHLPVCAELDLP